MQPTRVINRRYIVLDGMDLTGKTSAITKLVAELGLTEEALTLTKGVGGGPVGSAIRQELIPTANTESHNRHSIFYETLGMVMANIDALESVVMPSLDKGKLVISDRGISTFYAYQFHANKDNKVSGMSNDERTAHELFYRMFEYMPFHPGLYIFFKCSEENYTTRMSLRSESNYIDHRGYGYMKRVWEGFVRFGSLYGYDKNVPSPVIKWIDADQSIEKVQADVVAIVKAYMSDHIHTPLKETPWLPKSNQQALLPL